MKLLSFSACLLFTVVLISSTSCNKVSSEDLKDDVPYHQSYLVTFNQDDNKTYASAWFRVREANGTKVELSGNASVKLNGATHTGTGMSDKTRYMWTASGTGDVNFVLTKASGTLITNTINSGDVGQATFAANTPTVVSKSAGFKINWTGSSLTAGEHMTASITVNGGTHIATKDVTNEEIEFTSADLQNCPIGTIYIQLNRSKDFALDQRDQDAGGSIQVIRQESKQMSLDN